MLTAGWKPTISGTISPPFHTLAVALDGDEEGRQQTSLERSLSSPVQSAGTYASPFTRLGGILGRSANGSPPHLGFEKLSSSQLRNSLT